MKKIAILCILLAFTGIVFAQGNVLDNTGNDWVRWTNMEKQKFVVGWMSSLSSLIGLLDWWQENYELEEPTNNALNVIRQWAFYENVTVSDMIIIIDRVYSDPNTRRFKIYDVLLTMFEKEWW